MPQTFAIAEQADLVSVFLDIRNQKHLRYAFDKRGAMARELREIQFANRRLNATICGSLGVWLRNRRTI